MAKNIVYFDLETQKSADEVGGWGNISKMGLSIGVIFNTARDEYKIFHEQQVNELITELQRADLVVGFNNLRFDYEVLHGYTSFDLSQLPTLDMLVELQNTLNHRLFAGLNRNGDVWRGKNGGRFTGDPAGSRMASWWKSRSIVAMTLKLTKLVHEHGVHHRQLHYHNRFWKRSCRCG